MVVMNAPAQPHQPRPSLCHAESRQAEIDRIGKLTIEERIKLALSLQTRFADLRPAPRKE